MFRQQVAAVLPEADAPGSGLSSSSSSGSDAEDEEAEEQEEKMIRAEGHGCCAGGLLNLPAGGEAEEGEEGADDVLLELDDEDGTADERREAEEARRWQDMRQKVVQQQVAGQQQPKYGGV